MRRLASGVLMVILATVPAWADLTIRQTIELKLGSLFPPEVTGLITQQIGVAIPKEAVVRVKGSRCSSNFGSFMSIANGETGEITIVNPNTRQYAVVAASGLLGAQGTIPPDFTRALDNLEINVSTTKTGKSETIQGVPTAEYLTELTMSIPSPPQPPTPLRLELRSWRASDEALAAMPALKERASCSGGALNPAGVTQQLLEQLPAKLREFAQQLIDASGSAALKTHLSVFAPTLAVLMQARGTPPPANFDPAAALIEVNMDLIELSTAPLADSLFQPPAGYEAVTMADVMKGMSFGPPQAAPRTPAPRR